MGFLTTLTNPCAKRQKNVGLGKMYDDLSVIFLKEKGNVIKQQE